MVAVTGQTRLSIESPIWQRVERPLPPGVVAADWQQVDARLRQALVDAINRDMWPIYIHGRQGCGKSSAAAVLYRSLKFKQLRPYWIQLEEFVRQITACRNSKNRQVEIFSHETGEASYRSEAQWFQLIVRCPVLFIDDLGLRKPTDSAYEVVYKLFNSRIERPMVVTGNLDESALAEVYGRRIKSRVCAGTVISCSGNDRRDAKAVRVKV